MNEIATQTESGLICAYLIDGAGGGRKLDWAGIEQYEVDDGLLWVHLDFTDNGSRNWLLEKSGLDATVAEALVAEDSRPRSIQFERGILAVLRGVNTNPGSDVEDMVSIRVWLEENRIISTRRRRLLSIQDIQLQIEKATGPVNAGSFLAYLAERLVDRIGEVVDEIEDDIEVVESQIQLGELVNMRGKFSEFRRRTAGIRRYLAPQREALDRASRMKGNILSEQDCVTLHEQANNVTFYVEELDLARERTMVAQEEIMNNLAHEQNSKICLLSIVAAVFLPLSFLTGLMGMNVAGLPGTENTAAFNVIAIVMLALAVGILLLFRLKKWL